MASMPLEATQSAYGFLPVAAIKHISEKTGAWYATIYGTATYYGHLRFEPPAAVEAGNRIRELQSEEIEEVERCLRAGLAESPLIPHADTIAILEILDDARAALGVVYPGER